MKRFPFLLLSVLLLACEGPAGPMGPQGPAGPVGPTGTVGPKGADGATAHLFTAVIDSDGGAVAILPAAAGTDPTKPPAMACYMTDAPASGAWIAVNDGYSGTSAYCGLVFAGGTWRAVMVQGVSGYTAAFVVMY